MELDGGTHDDPAHAERDARRTQALAVRAIDVLRLRNDQVSEHFLRQMLAPYAQPSQDQEHGSGP